MRPRLKIHCVAAAIAIFCGTTAAATFPARLVINASSNSVDLVANEIVGVITVNFKDIEAIKRVRWDLVPKDHGLVKLNDLGVVHYDELNGELQISVRPELLQTQIVGTGPIQTSIPDSTPIQAVLVDYDIRTQQINNRTESGVILNGSTYLGLTRLEVAGAASTSQPSNLYKARLVREDLENSMLIEAGTILATPGTRGSPASIVGFGVRRDRAVTPGYITGPQLRFDGVAASKSTVDVLIDNQRVAGSQIANGPFSVVVGQPTTENGVAALVIRDELGQERIVTGRLFGNPNLIAVGQTEYGLWAGARSTVGLEAQGAVGTGFYRQGISPWLTGEASFETAAATSYSPTIARMSIGADIATKLGDIGIDVRGVGGLSQQSFTYTGTQKIGNWAFSYGGQTTRADVGYFNVAGGQESQFNRSGTISASAYGGSTYLTIADSPGGRFTLLGGSYRLADSGATVSISLSRFDSADSNARSSDSAYIGLSIPFGGGVSGNASTRSSVDGLVRRVALNTSVSTNSSVSIAAEGTHGIDRVQVDAFTSLESSQVMASVSKVDRQDVASRASIRGGLVVHRGGLSLIRPRNSDAGFALVDLGQAGVVVRNNLGGRAVTDSNGFAVLPMPALRSNTLYIDPNTADSVDLTPVTAVVHRQAGFEMKRRPVHGQFVALPAASGVLVVNSVRYSVTDRGAWLELPAGNYSGTLNGKAISFDLL